MDRQYSYFDYKHANWLLQRTVYHRQLSAVASEQDLVQLLTDMVQPLRDVHIKFVDPAGHESSSWQTSRQPNFSDAAWANSTAGSGYRVVKPYLGYARIRGVGYIRIDQWNDASFGPADLDSVLAHFQGEPRLIVDVRINGGGSDELAYAFAARFNTLSRVVGYYKYRDGPSHDDFDPLTPRVLGVRGPFQFTGRVLVLAGAWSYSSNESFISAMRELPDVSIVGDTTGGGSGKPATFDLGGGYQFTVPRWIEYTAEHQVIEWNGIPPDLYVPWSVSAAIGSSRDPVLELALKLLGASAR